jgi:CubicO group peptidase (beta-lactamase class C family)
VADVVRALDEAVDSTDFSGAVRLRRGADVLYERAHGLADRRFGIPNTLDTQFAIASGSKGFTALAVMSIVGAGALTLDTPVRSVLGTDLPLVDDGVTVAHLLEHTSGIGDFIDESAGGDVDDYVLPVPVHTLASVEDYLAVLDGYPQVSPPGERFAYNNGGYAVLAIVVERAAGRPFYDVVSDAVLVPAGMTATAYLRSDELPDSAATAYVRAGDGWRPNVLHLPVRGTGDGGAYTTLADMERFWAALLGGRLLDRATVEDMVRAHHDVPEERARYGRGFWLRADRDTVRLDGYDAGVSFRSACDPASDLLYTVVGNTSESAWPLVRILEDALPALVR